MINYKIIAKYIKDLEFKIPSSKIFFELSKNISNYRINIDIKSNQLKEKIVEITISLNLRPIKDDFEKINTKIIYAIIIEIDGDVNNKKFLEEIILIKVPNEVYSEIRNCFVFLFEKSGFKGIKIDESVDFKKLYAQRVI